jgi:hypothetical protein
MSDRDGGFYIGWQDRAPRPTAAFLRPVVTALLVGAVALAGVLVVAQNPFPPVRFEFGDARGFSGTVEGGTHPWLVVARPGATGEAEAASRYPMVSLGKLGAPPEIRERAGEAVELSGTLFYRSGLTMIEVDAPSVASAGGSPPASPGRVEDLGVHTLSGEIVDSKCFFGVMNPGNLKPHRLCAVRCISGGIPPVLYVHDDEGRVAYLLLVGEDGESVNREVLGLVAEPVEVRGRVERHGDLLVLRANPEGFRRL